MKNNFIRCMCVDLDKNVHLWRSEGVSLMSVVNVLQGLYIVKLIQISLADSKDGVHVISV